MKTHSKTAKKPGRGKSRVPHDAPSESQLEQDMSGLRALIQSVSQKPEFQAAMSISSSLSAEGLKAFPASLKQLTEVTNQVQAGDLQQAETIAISQAMTLDAMFHHLLRLGMSNLDTSSFEPLMRLALRAQAQSARTLEIVGALKSPVIFARQLNMANQQVVSNATPPAKKAEPSQPPMPPAALEPTKQPIVRLAKSPSRQRHYVRD